jgi:hypothetical protein
MPPEPSENMGMRQYRKESKYTIQEQKIIEPYKDAFRLQESKAGRLQILKCDILPAILRVLNEVKTHSSNRDLPKKIQCDRFYLSIFPTVSKYCATITKITDFTDHET